MQKTVAETSPAENRYEPPCESPGDASTRRRFDWTSPVALVFSLYMVSVGVDLPAIPSSAQHTVPIVIGTLAASAILVRSSYRRHRSEPERWSGRGFAVAAAVVLGLHLVLSLFILAQYAMQ